MTETTHDDLLIPYDAQCPHGTYYSDCQVCSGAKGDFERTCYEWADEMYPDSYTEVVA